MNPIKLGLLAGVSLVGLTILGGSWYTVDQGERAVILRNGKIISTAGPGLHFKLPLVDDADRISVQSLAQVYENVPTYSRDQQPATITLSVSFRIPEDQVDTVRSDYGSIGAVLSRLVDRKVNEQVKNVFGQFNAVTAIQDRSRLNNDVQTALQAAVKGPIIIEAVQIENIDFSDAYEASIEQRMLAEVEVQKIKQNAEREKVTAEITVIQAQAQADSQLAKAKADAEAVRLRGDAEAEAIRAKGAALRDNPALIGLVSAEKWDGVLPTQMVPGAAVPFVNVGGAQ